MGQWTGCPYVFCSASVYAEWMRTHADRPEAKRLMVPPHDIRHPLLTGPCPASNMWLPLEEEAVNILTERAKWDGRVIQYSIEHPPEPSPRNYPGNGVFPVRPLYPRGPGQLPGRMGRQPEEPQAPEWNPQIRGEDDEPRIKPSYVEGHLIGGRGMATVEDLVAQVTAANVKASEAIAALAEAREQEQAALGAISEAKNKFGNALGAVIEARDIIAGTMESSSSATLNEMLGLLQTAIDEHLTPGAATFDPAEHEMHFAVEKGTAGAGSCAAAMEKGEQFIGNALA